MKGTALAHTHYPHPCLRSRTDTDLMVRRGDLAIAAGVFEKLEYEALNMTQGDFVLHQRSYGRTGSRARCTDSDGCSKTSNAAS
jgi:hypothetical protein